MNEVFRTLARTVMPLLLLFSLFLLARGHDAPGGGFVGGLAATAAILLETAARGPEAAHRVHRLPLVRLAAAGLGLMLAVAGAGVARGGPVLDHAWWEAELPLLGRVALGTALAFDLGVYLAVVGSALAALLALEERGRPVLAPEEA